MPTARCNHVELYYEVHGEGEPLLCVMGLAADSLSWALQVPAWSARHRTVIFDNRDVGRSGYVEAGYTVPDMAADALALADELGLESFHLVGVSMGGTIAQEMALAAPERVRTLTLGVTFAGAGRWAQEKARLWARDAAGRTREDTVDELLLLCLSEEFFENPDAVAFAKQMMLSNPNPQRPEGFARQLEASCRHEARDRLGTLDMPVHVIGAEHDVLVPVWKSRELAELIPGAKLTVIERAPHGVNLERAEEFNRAVLDFIAEHAPAAA
jgi:pimeloyl-ACP methyl ester carboxylesterase